MWHLWCTRSYLVAFRGERIHLPAPHHEAILMGFKPSFISWSGDFNANQFFSPIAVRRCTFKSTQKARVQFFYTSIDDICDTLIPTVLRKIVPYRTTTNTTKIKPCIHGTVSHVWLTTLCACVDDWALFRFSCLKWVLSPSLGQSADSIRSAPWDLHPSKTPTSQLKSQMLFMINSEALFLLQSVFYT